MEGNKDKTTDRHELVTEVSRMYIYVGLFTISFIFNLVFSLNENKFIVYLIKYAIYRVQRMKILQFLYE